MQITRLIGVGGAILASCIHANANDTEDWTQGLVYNDGVFYTVHETEGMTYDPVTKRYVQFNDDPSPQIGGAGGLPMPSAGALPEAGPLLSSYNALGTAEEKRAYFQGLTVAEQASLFLELGSEDQQDMMRTFAFDNSTQQKYDQSVADLREFLAMLPAGEAGPALNLREPWAGRVYTGAPDYYGSKITAPLVGLDLAGLDLTGLDTTDKDLSGTNFSGSNITMAQLNAAYAAPDWTPAGWNWALHKTNLAGLDLAGLDTAGRYLYGVNFAGTNITGNQLNGASSIEQSDLSGTNLTGWNATGKSASGVNFVGSNVTVAQLNAATNIDGTNLAGFDLTGLDTTSKQLNGVNLVGSTISIEQLNSISGGEYGSGGIYGANLSGRDLTGLSLQGRAITGTNFANSNITPEQIVQAFTLVADYNAYDPNTWPVLRGTGITKAQMVAAIDAAGKTGTFGWNADWIHYD